MLARRCYALIPTALRRRLHRRLPFDRQVQLARWVGRPGGTLAVTVRQWYDDRSERATGRRWVHLDGRRVAADVDPDATPLTVHQGNLDRVLGALADASVEHFAIPHHRGLRSRVGVPASQRTEALRAVAGLPGVLVGRPNRRVVRPRPGRRPHRLRRADVVLVYRPLWTGEHLAYGAAYACELEFWHADDGRLTAPRPNALSRSLPSYRPNVRVPGASLNPFVPAGYHARYPVRADFAGVGADAVTFPIDAVYTWFDGTDPHWRSRYQAARHRQAPTGTQTADEPHRPDRDDLRHSLRSLHLYAPWLRHIYLVTDGQVPRWLDVRQPGLTVVGHRELFTADAVLPTFNPYAIESVLHLIPGLAEHFLYLGGNVLLGRPVLPGTFFHPNGLTRFFPSRSAQIDLGEPAYTDAPATAAAKNNRRIINRRFGRVISQQLKQAPYALRRSMLAEICAAVSEELAETRRHQFGHPGDVSLASALHHHWSYLRATAVPGQLRHFHADPTDPQTPVRLNDLLARRDHDTISLDGTAGAGVDRDRADVLARSFLAGYLPVRSPWEVTAEVEAERTQQTATELAHLLQPGVGVAGPVPTARPGQPGTTNRPTGNGLLQPR
ncbi:stealth conserved region 3 domain-containing protein [Micromonospora sp. NBC_01796]|uniref:stealth conserved region 3 domain-containing protein n=1 Tax=Micromonospora sp. NBC_01796 TaxID=2975987 RepID=UPI002DD9B59E|nr:stealth conserved region 3 domain-containing protein [Micromonospora sp. NBC_01796]WSA89245.1 stealth conserved region 3 domain-containing protein [Micromonospora sp. NBC_01796]